MADISKCEGVKNPDTQEVRKVCAQCYRRTAPGGERQAWIEPEARRVATVRWVCVNRVERIAA